MTIEDAGAPAADNGDFWLFGYGYVLSVVPPPSPERTSLGISWLYDSCAPTVFVGYESLV